MSIPKTCTRSILIANRAAVKRHQLPAAVDLWTNRDTLETEAP
jgi:hypothetical protein